MVIFYFMHSFHVLTHSVSFPSFFLSQSFIDSQFIHLFTHSCINSFTHSPLLTYIHPSIYSIFESSVRSFVLSFIHLSIDSGYMVWQGRICAQDFTDYQQCLLHALSESLNQDCTIPNCDQCLLDNELNTTSQLIAGPMDDYYNYKSANHDPSLVVTGCLSRSRDIHSTDDHADELRQSKTNLQKCDSDLTQTVNSTTLENTEFLRRRLHNTRPQTSPSKEITASFRQSPKPPYSNARFSNGDRAKTANQTRSSVFQNRFSSSMTSSFPSLELTNERIGSRRQLPLNVKTKKVKISVDEFSPV